nr:hypothetical protein [Escherichia coli]
MSWHDVTVERVVSAIAHRYGLKPQISEMLMDIEIDHADQTGRKRHVLPYAHGGNAGRNHHGKKAVICYSSCQAVA